MTSTTSSDPANSSSQEHYLARCVPWDWASSEQIVAFGSDGDEGRRLLDRWETIVFHQADGNTTLEAVTSWLPSQFANKSGLDPDFAEQLAKAARRLVDTVAFVEERPAPANIRYDFLIPRSDQKAEDRDEWDSLLPEADTE